MMKKSSIFKFSISNAKYIIARPFSTNPIDPDLEKSLPEFTYVGKNARKHTRVYVMGVSTHGGLGLKNLLRPRRLNAIFEYMHRPHRLKFAEFTKVVDVACGYGYTALATVPTDGYTCYGTGICTSCQIGFHKVRQDGLPMETVIIPVKVDVPIGSSARVTKVACGRAHTLMLTDNKGIWTVGNNSFGQCGRAIVEMEDYSSQAVYRRIDVLENKIIDQLECGLDTSFVLSKGVVHSCGCSTDGQTGRDSFECLDRFGRVEGDLKDENVIKVSSKGDTVLALTEKGDVFGWGNTEYKQLSSTTQQVSMPLKLDLNIGKVIDVAASGTACFALNENGDVFSWGYGYLGRGPENLWSEKPEIIPSTLLGRNILNKDSRVVKLFSGVHMAAAVTNTGGLYTWGKNTGGSLGLGHLNKQFFPLRVCVAGFVRKVSCGVDHVAILATSLI